MIITRVSADWYSVNDGEYVVKYIWDGWVVLKTEPGSAFGTTVAIRSTLNDALDALSKVVSA